MTLKKPHLLMVRLTVSVVTAVFNRYILVTPFLPVSAIPFKSLYNKEESMFFNLRRLSAFSLF